MNNTSTIRSKVAALIVAHNPDYATFALVLGSVARQVDRVIIVDNGSDNRSSLEDLCKKLGNCEFIEVGFNSGVAHALKVGARHAAIKHHPEWLLLLDDDTVVLNDALNKAFNIINNLPVNVKGKVGAVLLSSFVGDCTVKETRYGIFSGTLIKTQVALDTCCRDDFFLDQADFDMYSRIRELHYLALSINCKLVNHRIGQKRWIPILHKVTDYEPPWRYYYMVRNSTRLLIENRMRFSYYASQMMQWGSIIILVNGIRAFIKAFGLGLAHALLGEFGYLDRKFFDAK